MTQQSLESAPEVAFLTLSADSQLNSDRIVHPRDWSGSQMTFI